MREGRGAGRGFVVRIGRSLPYALLLAVAAFLFRAAGDADFVAPAGRIGPDAWPKIVIVLLACACVYGVVRRWLLPESPEVAGGLGSPALDAQGQIQGSERRPASVGGGIGLAMGYAWFVDELGFLLCTFLFLAAFAYLGGYRRHAVILASSGIGAVVLMFLFMRVVYISLPLGVPPFAGLSLAMMKLMGIK